MEKKTGNIWVPFCMRCNHVRKGDKDKCHVCSYPLETICLGCGTSPDQGEHECKVVTIPASPLAVQNSQLQAKVEDYKNTEATLMAKLFTTEEKLKDTKLQIGAWHPVIEAAEAMCKEDRWPYLNLGRIAHALDALHKTNDKCTVEVVIEGETKAPCGVTLPCGFHPPNDLSSPTNRPCCTEAYGRGYTMGQAHIANGKRTDELRIENGPDGIHRCVKCHSTSRPLVNHICR